MTTARRVARWVARWALALGAVAYLGWLLEFALPVRVSAWSGYVSGLGARDQPWTWVFRSFDAIAGLAALVGGLAGAWLASRARAGAGQAVAGRRLTMWGYAGLGGFGLCTLADAGLPLDCDPTGSRACRLAEGIGAVSTAHHLHSVTSVLAAVTSLAGGALLALGCAAAVRRTGEGRVGVGVGTRLEVGVGAALVVVVALAQAVAGGLIVRGLIVRGLIVRGLGSGAYAGVGLAQRIALAATSGLLAWAAWLVRPEHRR